MRTSSNGKQRVFLVRPRCPPCQDIPGLYLDVICGMVVHVSFLAPMKSKILGRNHMLL